MVDGIEGPLLSLPCLAHQGGMIIDGLCSGADGSSAESSSPCLQAEPAAAGSNDDREGHQPHLYDMSSLMAELPPVRRGLSRFYDGKSQSFRSLGSVKAVEDLPEHGSSRRRGGRSSCKKQMSVANLHGPSNLSKIIRKKLGAAT